VTKLSVNVNKVATLRNARGGRLPSVPDAVRAIVAAGAPGITVHPRADARHITASDVREIAALLASEAPGVEYNIEGDPRPDLLALVHAIRPTQCTLVPVTPGEVTSQAGWPPDTDAAEMRRIVEALERDGIRVSVFVDPEAEAVAWAADVGAHRVELYTEPYARAFELGGRQLAQSVERYGRAAEAAHARGLAVNAGHDLDLANLVPFREVPHVAEVSIGHALISHALFVGLDRAVRDYLAVLAGQAGGG
jgi:pyridoxine 5-phosphate synthase